MSRGQDDDDGAESAGGAGGEEEGVGAEHERAEGAVQLVGEEAQLGDLLQSQHEQTVGVDLLRDRVANFSGIAQCAKRQKEGSLKVRQICCEFCVFKCGSTASPSDSGP